MLHTIKGRVHWHDFEAYTDPEYSLHEQRDECLYKDITETIFMLLCYACSKHRSVQFIRFDVTFGQERHFLHYMLYFKLFLSDFAKKCERLEKERVASYYFWSREKKKDDRNPHFHFFLLLCDRTQKEYKFLLKEAQKILGWKLQRGGFEGHLNFGDKNKYKSYQSNGRIIKQNGILNEREFRHCFQWATYLAKKRTKENFSSRTRRFNKSKLPAEAFDTNWLEWFYRQFPQKK